MCTNTYAKQYNQLGDSKIYDFKLDVYHKVNNISKKLGIEIPRHLETMIYPEVHFPMEASLRWSGAESQSDPRIAVKWHTVISFVPPPMRSVTIHYGTLEGGHRTRTRMRHTPQLNWRLSPESRGSQSHKNHKAGARLHNSIGGSRLVPAAPKATRTSNDRLGFQ